jgi:2-enoate reductase
MMKLFEEGKIGKLTVKNRIVMAPMSIGALEAPDGRYSQRCLDYFAARAKRGVGLIIAGLGVGHIITSDDPVRPEYPMDKVWLNELADTLHEYGTKVCVQLSVGGGRCVPSKSPVAPSVLPCWFDPGVMTRELTVKEIHELIESIRIAAETVSDTRVDAIELHCHGGYLADEFMTSLWNKRTDEYGGNLDGRLRFIMEMIQAVKTETRPDFPLILRYGPDHFYEGARGIDEGLEIARRLEKAGVTALDLDAGCYEAHYWLIPSKYQPPGCSVSLSEAVKKVVNIPVMIVGKLGYPEIAESTLVEGKADFIVLGRALLAEPDWANKVKENKFEDIRPCIGCHEGCHVRIREGEYISCAINPITGMERELALKPAEKKKSVLVIGGGPGGMEASIISAYKGHRVTLLEKSDSLGGNLTPASIPDFKHDYRRLITYFSTQLKKLGVAMELGKEATPEIIKEMNPDVVFIATGSTPLVPEFPGRKKRRLITASDLLTGKKNAGKSVVMIGGGLVGCETALYLAQKGKEVTILESLDSIARDLWSASRLHLLQLLADANVDVLTSINILEITDKYVVIADKNSEKKILKADTIAIAVGYKSDNRLYEMLKDSGLEVHIIGDCVKPRQILSAVWDGFHAARLI